MLSLVIPVYRNAESIPRLFQELEHLAAGLTDDLEVVFVVDGSPDASLQMLQDRLPLWPVRSRLVELARNFGSFAAIAAGLREGEGDYFAVLAADMQEPPELVAQFLQLMQSGQADVTFGHRVARADPFWSRVLSDSFWAVYRRYVVKDMPKGGVDVFGCTRQVRDHLATFRELNTNLVALLLWLGFRRAFVPYARRPRLEGKSAWTFGRKLRYAVDSVFSFTDLPIRALLLMGAVGTTAAVVASLTVFVYWLLGRVPVLGYTPLMLMITFFGGLTALGLGIVGQYLWLSLQSSRGRPNFIVKATWTFAGASANTRPTNPVPRI
ncbi:MAG: glycosyltransferase family 2 protein [Vicinamibacterales bacterium]